MVLCLECLELTVTSDCSITAGSDTGSFASAFGHSQLEAAYGASEVTEVGKKGMAGCDSMV